MEQRDFHSILKRYLQGQASAEEKRIVDSWYEAMGKGPQSTLSGQEASQLERRYWLRIASHVKSAKKIDPSGVLTKNNSKSLTLWYPIGIAASILLFIAAGIYAITNKQKVKGGFAPGKENSSFTWTRLTNTQEIPQQIILPDGSKVTLEPATHLKYSSAFNESKREIYLEGEALFEVSHNKQRPFFVHANEVTAKVLGTSFIVKAFKADKHVTISVRTGSVSVYTNPENVKEKTPSPEIILTPNQQIVYNKNKHTISRSIVEVPQAILSEEKIKRMRFEDAPIKEIFEAIEKVYGVTIVFDENQFSSCALTTSISDGDLYNRLDIICKAIGATYTLRENVIVINGTGCN